MLRNVHRHCSKARAPPTLAGPTKVVCPSYGTRRISADGRVQSISPHFRTGCWQSTLGRSAERLAVDNDARAPKILEPNDFGHDEATQDYLSLYKKVQTTCSLSRNRRHSTYLRLRDVQGRYLSHGQKRSSKRKPTDSDATPLDRSWKSVSATHLLRHVLIRHDTRRWASWVRTVAALRTERLSVVVLQLMLRDGMLPRPTDPTALPLLPALLPDDKTWGDLLAHLERQGHTASQLEYYAHILSAQSNNERIERFLKRDDFKPLFIFSFLLRCGVEKVEHLEDLVQYCRRWYTTRRNGPQSWQHSVPLLTVDLKDHGHPLRLLLDNCYHVDPRLLPDIAQIASTLFTKVSPGNAQGEEWKQLRQSRIFNQVICLFRQSNYGIIPKRKLPAAYTWAAVEILLNASASLERPCVTSLGGFRAIKEVMASQNRDQKDLRIIPRLSESWPPYLRPGDGMDEATEPDENWSRAVLASAFMQENGYAKEEADLALDALQGMAPDGTPTIHQNETIARAGGMRFWEASIMATRNSVEAWQIFQRCPGDPNAKPTAQEYTAMFQKLLYRDVGPSEKAFPGDRNINFPSTVYNSFTELERLRLQPPTVDELYTRMRSDKIPLDLRCLSLLVSHASSMHEVSTYIYESSLPGRMKKAFISWEAWDKNLLKSRSAANIAVKFFPVFATALMRLVRPPADRLRQIVERAVDVIRAAGVHGPVQMAGFWPHVFGALGKRSAWPMADPKEQLAAILHAARLTEEAGQMSLAAFEKMADALRNLVSFQLGALNTDGSSPSNFMLDFYDPLARDKQPYATTIGECYARGGALIDSSISNGLGSGLALATFVLKHNFARLVKEEQHAQSLLGHHSVPPIERMMNRRDPVQADQVQSVVAALVHLGDFAEAARVLGWAVSQWMEPDVVDALRYLDDDAGFHVAFCLFRKLAEPVLPREVVQDLKTMITSDNSPFRWPGVDEVEEYFTTMAGESESQLATVLEHVQSRDAERRAQNYSAGNILDGFNESIAPRARARPGSTMQPGMRGLARPIG